MKKYFLLSIVLVGLSVFGKHEMFQIKRWEGVKPFAGKVIIFSADSYYYTSRACDASGQYENSSQRVALIDKFPTTLPGGKTAYGMLKLQTIELAPGVNVLASDILFNAGMQMRLASREERAQILRLLDEKRVRFELMSIGGLESLARAALQE